MPIALPSESLENFAEQMRRWFGALRFEIEQELEQTEDYFHSVLGEFGMGKTWFTLHYAWRELQKYLKAKETQRKRPRLPLLMPLRDYAKAMDVENVLAHFFFGKHKIRLHNEVFDRLNAMGKLLLIFDGFDEMSNKTSKQEMADNFWQLAQVAVPDAKVILTSRQEHFPSDGNARLLFGGKIPASQSRSLVAPQFELVELGPFTDVQMRRSWGYCMRISGDWWKVVGCWELLGQRQGKNYVLIL